MKTTIRTIELTVEKRESTFMRRSRTSTRAFCQVCGGESEMRAAASISEKFTLSPRDISNLVANKSVGSYELPDGSLLICLNCIETLP